MQSMVPCNWKRVSQKLLMNTRSLLLTMEVGILWSFTTWFTKALTTYKALYGWDKKIKCSYLDNQSTITTDCPFENGKLPQSPWRCQTRCSQELKVVEANMSVKHSPIYYVDKCHIVEYNPWQCQARENRNEDRIKSYGTRSGH